MASAHTLPLAIDRCLRTGFFNVDDPGSAGTISWENKGRAICLVVTAGAESRALPSASKFAVGTILYVIFKTDGGDLSITGAVGGTVTLTTAGSFAKFLITTSGETRQWVVEA
jgi:hypothetical protein